jgi:hypothetical protein
LRTAEDVAVRNLDLKAGEVRCEFGQSDDRFLAVGVVEFVQLLATATMACAVVPS